jgi:hypothetical protein
MAPAPARRHAARGGPGGPGGRRRPNGAATGPGTGFGDREKFQKTHGKIGLDMDGDDLSLNFRD